jgi:hypothetical protein
MFHKKLRFGVLLALVMVFCLAVSPAFAAPSAQATVPESGGFGDLAAQWFGLAGFAGLIALLINIGKRVGFVKDGTAQTWSAGLNLIGLALLLLTQVYKPDLAIRDLDTQVGEFVKVGTVVLGYVIQLLASKGTHVAVRGVPVIGTSHTE